MQQEALHPTRSLPALCTLRSQSLVQVATSPNTHPTPPRGHGWAGHPLPAGLDPPPTYTHTHTPTSQIWQGHYLNKRIWTDTRK